MTVIFILVNSCCETLTLFSFAVILTKSKTRVDPKKQRAVQLLQIWVVPYVLVVLYVLAVYILFILCIHISFFWNFLYDVVKLMCGCRVGK